MNPFRRIVGVFLVATGMLIAVHTIIEPLYHVSSEPIHTVRSGAFSTS